MQVMLCHLFTAFFIVEMISFFFFFFLHSEDSVNSFCGLYCDAKLVKN